MGTDLPSERRVRLSTGELDLVSGVLSSPLGAIRLTEIERGLLGYLYARRGHVVGREELLEQVWGYRPGVRSHTLETTIQRLRIKIERNVRAPEHLLNVRGRGYRLMIGEPTVPRASASSDGVGLLEPIFGRDDALDKIATWIIEGVRIVTVTGPPGIGKTWLAREVLGRLRTSAHGPDVAFVPLCGHRTRADLIEATTAALGAPADARAQRAMHAVWVLDDASMLDDAAAEQIRRWLQRYPDLTVIATAHARLGIEGERALPLELLSVEAAVQLLRARLAALALPEPSAAVLEGLARRTERLPLLLDGLAASLGTGHARDLDIARILDVPPARRTGGARSLREAVATAVGRLDDRLARALVLLSAPSGAFSAESAATVLGPGGEGALLELWRRSLVVRLPDGRFLLYESVRSCVVTGLPARQTVSVRSWDNHEDT